MLRLKCNKTTEKIHLLNLLEKNVNLSDEFISIAIYYKILLFICTQILLIINVDKLL